MTKKKRYFLRYLIFGERISLVQYQSNSFFQWERFSVKSQQVLFFVVLFLPSFGMQNLLHSVFNENSSSWSSEICVSLLFKFITNLIDPWEIVTQEWALSLFKDKILTSTPYLPCKQLGCNFQYGPNFGVSLDPAFRLWCFFFWKSVLTTGYCIKLCEISSVFRHEILSILNNTQKSCIHTEFTQFVLLWQLLNSLSILLQKKFLIRWVIIIQRNFCLDRTEHEIGSWLSHINGSHSSLVKGFILFTYLCDCSVKTELVCRYKYAKKSQSFPGRLHGE